MKARVALDWDYVRFLLLSHDVYDDSHVFVSYMQEEIALDFNSQERVKWFPCKVKDKK